MMALNRENVIRAAEKYVSKGKLEAAIKEYRKVLAENPNDANTLNRVGDLYARIERFDEAVKLFSQIAEQYTRDGFFVKAIAIYKKIIKLDPTSLAVYERLAELYHKQGLLNEARTQYQVLADYYQKHDNAASAITIYQRMAELEPDNPSFHLKLAELFKSQQLIDKAMKEYRLLADLLIVGGSVEEAVQVYLKALEVSSEDLEFVREAVRGLHDTGNVSEAARVLSRAVELNPDAAKIAHQVGLDKQGQGEAGAQEAADGEIFAADEAFDDDDTFEVPETSLDEIQEALEETRISASAAADAVITGADDEAFTFDLDDDEVPESLVTPPPDVLEADAAASSGEGRVEIAEDAGAEESVPAQTDEIEIEWPLPGMDELELEVAADETDLDETVVSRSVSPADRPIEPEAFELGELEPDELEPDELELELEPIEVELEGETFEAAAEAVAPDDSAEAAPGFDERREEDLLAEAKVFAKYGLTEKARDRLSELFQIRGDHLEGLELQTRIELEAGQMSEAAASANLVSRIAGQTGRPDIWSSLKAALLEAGFNIEGERVVSEPGAKPVEDDRIAQLLDDLSLEAFDTPVTAPQPDAAPERSDADSVEPAADEPAAAASAGKPPEEKKLVSLVDELGLDELGLDELAVEKEVPSAGVPVPEAVPVAARAEAPADLLDETGMSWLDELETEDSAAAGEDETIFDEEDDFFDLAAELERELTADEAEAAGEALQPQEQSLEEIIEGFKQGVAENLSPEDYDTHFNLGIAYREMGLLDEAIGEFQLAAKDERYVVDSSSLLGICFLEKGLPELAVRSYRKGLESPSISAEATLGLLYDMGTAYMTLGDSEAAYKTFVEVYGLNSHYRDVSDKLQELKAES